MTILLTEGAWARVGDRVVYQSGDPVGAASLRYFATALGVSSAPPTFVCETCQFVSRPADVDGYAGHGWDLEFRAPTTMIRLANRYEFGVPVLAATIVTTTWTLERLEERPLGVRATSVVTYEDQHGRLLATNEELALFRPLSAPPIVSQPRTATLFAAGALAGDGVDVWSRSLTLTDLVAYSGATWDHHRLHYDDAYARAAGFPGPIVDGQMWGALFASRAFALAAARSEGRELATLDVRYLSPLSVPNDIQVISVWSDTAQDAEPREVAQEIVSGNQLVASATSALRRAE